LRNSREGSTVVEPHERAFNVEEEEKKKKKA
jgi:hypothetical protein